MKKRWLCRGFLLFLLMCPAFLSGRGLSVRAASTGPEEPAAPERTEQRAASGRTEESAASGESVDSLVSAAMKLMKTEGTVTIENASGRSLSVREHMNLYHGYRTGTEEESYAWIRLDDEKLAKLDAVSEAEVRRTGEQLEILLDSGNLFFDVSEPLEETETLNIRTSTMVVGIRGTSGWVKVLDRWRSRVCILEGTVACYVSDPLTGQTKSTVLTGGETAEFVVYEQGQEGERCDILRDRFSEGEIDGFVLVELAENPSLCEKIEAESGLTPGSVITGARDRLASDEAQMKGMLEYIREQYENQAHHISVDPVWVGSGSDAGEREGENAFGQDGGTFGGGGNASGSGTAPGGSGNPSGPGTAPGGAETASDSGSSSGGGGNSGTSAPVGGPAVSAPPVELTDGTDATDQGTLQNLLNNPDTGEVVVKKDPASGTPGTVDVTSSMTIPEGKTLTLEDGMDLNVDPGATVTVNGTLKVGGTLTNNGTIIVNSSN